MALRKVILLTETVFETLREQDRLKVDQPYGVREKNKTMYAITHDGVGFNWYNTLAELESEHG